MTDESQWIPIVGSTIVAVSAITGSVVSKSGLRGVTSVPERQKRQQRGNVKATGFSVRRFSNSK